MIHVEQAPDQGRNADRVKGDRTPCYICGRAINMDGDKYFWIEVGGGGYDALLPHEVDASDAGYMGCHPIGADCLKKQPALAPYARRATAHPEHRVGCAYRCADGLVRWIEYLSTRGNYGVRWREEGGDTWYSGGTYSVAKWLEHFGEAVEVGAPQPGETYKLADPMGRVGERVVPLKMLAATRQKQGEREGDFFHAREGELVLLSDDCDQLHAGCDCQRSMVGAETGKGTTTMMIVAREMRRADFIEAVRRGELAGQFDELLSTKAFEEEANQLLTLAGYFPVGAVIERSGDNFNLRV